MRRHVSGRSKENGFYGNDAYDWVQHGNATNLFMYTGGRCKNLVLCVEEFEYMRKYWD